jgi:competence protein ComEC
MAARLDPGWRIAMAVLAWGVGLALQLRQPALWPVAAYQALLAASAALLLWPRTRRHMVPMALALAALSFASTGWRANWRLADALAPELEGVDLVVTGVVAAMPDVSADGVRLRLRVEQAERVAGGPVALPRLLSLGWYLGWHDDALLAGPIEELRAGQRWQLPVRLRQPHGLANPHGFDAELWMFEQGLRASGYVRVKAGGPQPRRLAERVAHPVERLRQDIRDAIFERVADARAAGVLAALVVGDQAAIEREDWELFRRTGVAHLMSISGLHVTMFAWAAGLLVGVLWRRSGRAMLWRPAPWATRWGGLLVAALYALLAGWGVPAQRTVGMLAAAAALRTLGAQWPWPLVLLLAGAAVTLADPWALLQPGFWLSFAAVGLLMMSEPTQQEQADRDRAGGWRQRLAGAWRSQGVATIGLAPLSMLFFQQVSLVGLAANLVAIPLVTLLVTPLALAGALAAPLWQPAAWLVQALTQALAMLSGVGWAVWSAAAAPVWALACGLLAACVAVLPLPWRLRALAVPLALPMLAPAVARPAAGGFELVAADIGQGTAVLVRTRNHLLVYDSGPQYSRDSDAGQRVLLPLLRARGESRIDLLMISHRDGDHAGGAASLLDALPAGGLSSSIDAAHPLRAKPVPQHTCQDGQRWTWDGVHFELLHPTPAGLALGGKPNALSCVLRVQDAQGRSALLAGDIEAPQEAVLAARHGERLASTMLLVPHHGSRGASSQALLSQVQPKVAVVQAGYRSRFGHPAPEVLARLTEQGAKVVRSDRCGAWTWLGETFRCERAAHRRYWHWQPGPEVQDVGADVAKALAAGERSR